MTSPDDTIHHHQEGTDQMTTTENNQQNMAAAQSVPGLRPDDGPVLDPADPNYYEGRGITSWAEKQMRADFARAEALHAEALNIGIDDGLDFDAAMDKADAIRDRAYDIDRRYRAHPSEQVREDWEYLSDAVQDWKAAPETMVRFHDSYAADRQNGLFEALTPEQWRSQQQARELTGHGEWPRMPRPDIARYDKDHPVPSFGAASKARTAELASGTPKREPIRGHAFAGLVNGRDHEGMER
ncbi:hypothetical protein [Nocardia cyriacigeorgica]|uniref:hypothetical protein n=1 Tax=Nocardia cyriacigeorgica TaxID=135487 RepID=UPI00351790A9